MLEELMAEWKRDADRSVRIGEVARIFCKHLEDKMNYDEHAEVQDFSDAVFGELNALAKSPEAATP